MPLLPPNLAAILAANLVPTGHVGVAMPRFAQAIAVGVSLWGGKAQVSVHGTGLAGTGVASIAMAVPQPLLLANLQAGFASQGITGVFSPMTVLGLANGLAVALPQGILVATVVGVGSGAGIARILSSPAFPSFQQGFSSFGMAGLGTLKIARALGLAFDQTFAAFSIALPIVGPAGTAPGVGTGTGKIA